MYRDIFSKQANGWQRQVTKLVGEHKVRATVYRDSYDFQSRLYVEVWSESTLSWSRIQTLSGTDYPDLTSRYTPDLQAHARMTSDPVIIGMFGYAEELLS